VIKEIFRLDEMGCTKTTDTHSASNWMNNAPPGRTNCPLCDYTVVREAKQSVGAEIKEKNPGDLDRGVELPADLEKDFHNSADYHLLSIKVSGTPCLYQGKPKDWANPSISATPSGKVSSQWSLPFWWATPCDPPPTTGPRPPPSGPPWTPPPPPQPKKPRTPTTGGGNPAPGHAGGRPAFGSGLFPPGMRPGTGKWEDPDSWYEEKKDDQKDKKQSDKRTEEKKPMAKRKRP
jgi:hypothetical protein